MERLGLIRFEAGSMRLQGLLSRLLPGRSCCLDWGREGGAGEEEAQERDGVSNKRRERKKVEGSREM